MTEFFQKRGTDESEGHLYIKFEKIDRMTGTRKTQQALLRFDSAESQDLVYTVMRKLVPATCMTASNDIAAFTQEWRAGSLTNLEYLQVLNTFANRTKLDLDNYPVYPWVLKDYDSDVLDLADPESFRDLS